ncbi:MULTISPECIES: hypothetical protein [Legionella]|uniref:Uncharacterized protein n=1 Tax=Legionella rubrilucens TaxID=458 RepID=A0A0W0XVL0_9GAMM|nr:MULTISPECIES: hypothetical protein [Legionella]KTD48436.1 hypothetical protein Lrub_0787 [Legionella rubrilucens]MDX1837633.1 hypothetical protein [Legionella taurinensis]
MSSHPLNVRCHVHLASRVHLVHRDASFVGANFDASYDATCSGIESNAIYVHPNATYHVHHEVSNEVDDGHWQPIS